MSKYASRIAFAFCTLVLAAFALVRWARSCADPGDPFDDYSIHPDVPIEKFSQGHLGIVQPTFARSYLVVAYRYASGVPLTHDERAAAEALWLNRGIEATNVYESYYDGGSAQAHRQNRYVRQMQDDADGPKDWIAARGQVASTPAPQINQLQGWNKYDNYLNCSNDALATAAATLTQRAAKFGRDHAAITEWIAAQDAVFDNCGGDPEKPSVPAAPSSSLPELLRYDREYQIAAAYMYSNHYDEAVQGFQRIAAEKNSPWHEVAPYLTARTMLRRATLDIPQPEAAQYGLAQIPPFEQGKLEDAVAYTNKLLADPQNSHFAVPLQALLDRAEFRLHPAQQTLQLSERLRKPAPDGRFYDWLWDYTWLLDRRGDSTGDYGHSGNAEEYAKLTSERRKDPLTDWIVTFQIHAPAATEHALESWRAHRESMPWLLAVLSKTEANAAYVLEVLSATTAWCAAPQAFRDENTYWRSDQQPTSPLNPPPFLTETQRQEAEAEQFALDRVDSQANYYTKVVFDFAAKHPDDPRVPEALSRAVKNTRMNCNNPRTGELSEKAFNLLHQRYPNSRWAKNTKYWYGEGY